MRYFLIIFLMASSLFAQESLTVGQAEMQYNREYNAAKAIFDRSTKIAKDKFINLLKNEMTKLTQKGDLDGAITINEKIKSLKLEVVKDNLNQKFSNFIGTYKGLVMGKEGSYRITFDKGVYILEELTPHQFKSVSSITFKDLLLFQWPNNNDLISVELVDNSIIFICWKHGSQGGFIARQPSGEFWWKSTMKKD